MGVKLNDLSKKVGLEPQKLREKIAEFGFDLKPRATVIDDDIAQLIEEELVQKAKDDAGTVELYDELFAQEREKEIVKSQRKKMAGKVTAKKRNESRKIQTSTVVAATGEMIIEIPDAITVKEFAEKTGINPVKIIGELMKNGILANINQPIDFETAQIIADDFNIKLKKKHAGASVQDLMTGNLESLIKEDDTADLKLRPPVVTIMGHVDHGKTKLLDAIRETNVVEGEAGGITQRIGAYQVVKNDRLITFIDTPGHEAFSAMRARGAKVTDIAILVVSADEGIKPQTLEALNHIKEAEVPILVAITKIDKENANVDKVKAELSEQGLQPEEWGGTTVMVPVSAITGEGVNRLLEMILLVADMEHLQANPNRPAIGTIIETNLDKNLGPVATALVNTGTLHVGDTVVVGNTYGRIKTMKDHRGKNLSEVLPSGPAQISGLETQPKLGDILQAVGTEQEARKKALSILQIRKQEASTSSIKEIISQIHAGKLKNLKLIVKADMNGSLEAIKQALGKLKNDEVSVKVIHSGVGMVTETDVNMARSSGGLVVGFNVIVGTHVRKTAERMGVEILQYQIIYKLTEDMTNLLSGLLEPEKITTDLGKAEVKQIFYSGKKEVIVGCKVTNGLMENKAMLKVLRKNAPVGEGLIVSLRKGDETIEKIKEGNECGIKFSGSVTLEPGDVLEAYKEEYKKKTLTLA